MPSLPARDQLSGWYALRWLILLLWPAGWWATAELWADYDVQYAAWTTVATVGAATFLYYRSHAHWLSEGHLWIIFLVLVTGYFVKWYVLVGVLAFSNDEALLKLLTPYLPVEPTADVLLEAFATATVAFCAFCATSALLTGNRAQSHGRGHEATASRPERPSQVRSRLLWLLALAVIASVLTLGLQAATRSAVVSADEVVLPYRLGGIVQLARATAIPALLLLVAYFADRAGQRLVGDAAAGLYVAHNVASGIWSTSKQPVILAIAGLAALWFATGNLNRRRLGVLLTAIPFVLVLTTLLSFTRVLRSSGELGLLESVPEAVSEFGAEQTLWQSLLLAAAALLMRVNGIDTLTWFVAYEPPIDLGRTLWMLFQSGADINALFAEEVLGLRDLTGVAFSTSLVGFFYFLLGSKWLTGLAIAAYTLLWHALLTALDRAPFMCRPVLLVMAWVLVVFFTIDGNLQSLPQAFMLLLVATGGVELLARLVLGKQNDPVPLPLPA